MAFAQPREDRLALGVGIMAFAVLCFTGIDTSAKWLILSGLTPLQVVFCRYAGHFLVSAAIFVPRNGWEAFHSNRPRLQLLRTAFLACGTFLNFFALKFLPITITTTIFFATPILVTLLSIPILNENVGIRRMIAVLVGFVGVLIVIQPWGVRFHPAIFFSLGALVCASLYFVMTRLLAGSEAAAVSQLWPSGLPMVVLAPIVIGSWVWPDTMLGYAVMLLIGALGAIGHMAAVSAHRFADASILSPVVYLQLIFATAAGILVFATPPTIWTLVGGLVIVGSGIYIWQRERRLRG